MKRNIYLMLFLLCLNFNCSEDNSLKEENTELNQEPNIPDEKGANTNNQTNFKILSLGDSYTIGQGVCATCSFPEQLKNKLKSEIGSDKTIDLNIIATTGWSTSNLIRALNERNTPSDYDLVTLLIGVNNQFQNTAFSVYESEFPQLVTKSVTFAKRQKSNIIVISIPDYSFTPYGLNTPNSVNISPEIDRYNNFAETYCKTNGIAFVNITDISRSGLMNSGLVADDNLHLSELAYSRFVTRLLPIALEKLRD
jgi:lysophospholipase L1-like esterase